MCDGLGGIGAIKSSMLAFSARLCSGNKHNISNTINSLLYTIENNIFKSEWIQTLNTTLNNRGFSVLYLNQAIPCSVFKQSVKLRLKYQVIHQMA